MAQLKLEIMSVSQKLEKTKFNYPNRFLFTWRHYSRLKEHYDINIICESKLRFEKNQILKKLYYLFGYLHGNVL